MFDFSRKGNKIDVTSVHISLRVSKLSFSVKLIIRHWRKWINWAVLSFNFPGISERNIDIHIRIINVLYFYIFNLYWIWPYVFRNGWIKMNENVKIENILINFFINKKYKPKNRKFLTTNELFLPHHISISVCCIRLKMICCTHCILLGANCCPIEILIA